MASDHKPACWNCRHWQHGTQSESYRAKDRDRGYPAACEKVEALIHVIVGGNRGSWRDEPSDSLDVSPMFCCPLWEELDRSHHTHDEQP